MSLGRSFRVRLSYALVATTCRSHSHVSHALSSAAQSEQQRETVLGAASPAITFPAHSETENGGGGNGSVRFGGVGDERACASDEAPHAFSVCNLALPHRRAEISSAPTASW
jgi:hypothetical protein